MNVECRLRELRGRVSLKEMERLTGINRGALSRYERGREFPPERDVPILERYYGAPRADWYPKQVAPHAERKPRPKPTGIRITLQPDELAILRAFLDRAVWVVKGDDTAVARRLAAKVVRASERAA